MFCLFDWLGFVWVCFLLFLWKERNNLAPSTRDETHGLGAWGDPFSLLFFTVMLLSSYAQYFILMGGVPGYRQLYSRDETEIVLAALKR